MGRLLIKGGIIISPKDKLLYEKKDILIENSKILKIEKNIIAENINVLDASDLYIAPGLIDIHTHCFKGNSPIGTEADSIGVYKGCTSIFDAGTAGPKNFEKFKKNCIEQSVTELYSILNVSNFGLDRLNELTDLSEIDLDLIEKVCEENKDIIKGIKVRASKSVVGENGIKPIEIAKEISKKLKLPLVVHIGNYPPYIEEVVDLLEKNDVITHAYHGKVNGIFNEDGMLKECIIKAKERGVLFDVGHGSESFSFKVFENALKLGLEPDLISTDIYERNMDKPVHSLLSVINKVTEFGISLEDCIEKVTSYPAEVFNLNNGIGRIELDGKCNLTIFEKIKKEECLEDSVKNKLNIKNKLNLKYTIKTRGDDFEIFRNC